TCPKGRGRRGRGGAKFAAPSTGEGRVPTGAPAAFLPVVAHIPSPILPMAERTSFATDRPRGARRTASPADNPLDMGRMPPQAPELEQAVLGAMMLERHAV